MAKEIEPPVKNDQKSNIEDDFDDPILHEKPTSFSDFVDLMTNFKKRKKKNS